MQNDELFSGGIERISNGVDGDTSPNEIGDFSMRGLLSDEQTGRNSIGGEYVVIVSGNVMPVKEKKNKQSVLYLSVALQWNVVVCYCNFIETYPPLHLKAALLLFSNQVMV